MNISNNTHIQDTNNFQFSKEIVTESGKTYLTVGVQKGHLAFLTRQGYTVLFDIKVVD